MSTVIDPSYWHAAGTERVKGEDVRRASKDIKLIGCKLSRKDLDEVISLMLSGSGEKLFVKIETELGITSIEAESLEEFMADIGDADVLRYLRVWVASQEDSRTTTFWIRSGRAEVWARGEDETWVRGRVETIAARLKLTRPRFLVPTWALTISGAMASMISLFFSLASKGITRAIGSNFFISVYILIWFVYLVQIRMRRSRVVLAPEVKSWWQVLERWMTITIAFGTVVIAIFTVLLWKLTSK